MKKAVAVVSGGMDSVTLAYMLADTKGMDLDLVLSADYGQRHRKELAFAEECAHDLGVPWECIDLAQVGSLLKGSSLTDPSVPVPHGHYAAESMKATIVPNRNAIMLNIAAGIAIGRGATSVYTGVHAGDHPIYPDCRPEFIRSLNSCIHIATEAHIQVEAPFMTIGKDQIASIGDTLGVPWDKTWSCYEGGEVHCGQCGTCVERREAFSLAGVPDPTVYKEVAGG
jgi:7-cyano-7-deazaguanine synthase